MYDKVCSNRLKIYHSPQNSRRQNGYMKPVRQWITTNTRCNPTKFSPQGEIWRPGLVQLFICPTHALFQKCWFSWFSSVTEAEFLDIIINFTNQSNLLLISTTRTVLYFIPKVSNGKDPLNILRVKQFFIRNFQHSNSWTSKDAWYPTTLHWPPPTAVITERHSDMSSPIQREDFRIQIRKETTPHPPPPPTFWRDTIL
jgi:hypothetical protein